MGEAGPGGLDFNDAAPPRGSQPKEQYDLEALADALGAVAESWVASYFPQGRRDGDEIRCADISGRAPRKQGSCVIQVAGPQGGWWIDHGTGEGGGPLSLLKKCTGLEGAALLKEAAQLCGWTAVNNREDHHAKKMARPKDARKEAAEQEISNLLAHALPATGTLVETYLISRKLALPSDADLLFCPNATDWAEKVGRPAMLGVVKMADGTPTQGLHRTYLAYDGNGKAPTGKQKMMLGPVKGGSVHLGTMGDDGLLGVAEGIETGIAAQMTWNMPVWAALSTSGMRELALPDGLKQIVIFADAGEAGETAAVVLLERALAAGAQGRIERPKGGDDFNADIVAASVIREEPGRAEGGDGGGMSSGPAGLVSRINALHKDASPDEIAGCLRGLAVSNADPIARAQSLQRIKKQTGLDISLLRAQMKALVREVGTSISTRPGAPDWITTLIASEEGEPRPILANAVQALSVAPELQNLLWMDTFSRRPMLRKRAPWEAADLAFEERPWDDNDDLQLTVHLQNAGLLIPSFVVREAILVTAANAPYHPVVDYLDALEWDNVPRIETWTIRHLGCDDTPYIRACASRWMISAVSRIYRPGVKADCMIVLEGEQNIGKSAVLKALFDPWFSDEMPDPGSKEAPISMLGKWCVEFAELEVLSRVETGKLKAFMRRMVDRYRPMFGHYAVDQPRQCIFAGTVNKYDWGNDTTGLSRFWPMKCQFAKPLAVYAERDQLWAEAATAYRMGAVTYLHEESLIADASAEQDQRQPDDVWDARIETYLSATTWKNEFRISDVLEGMGIPVQQWDVSSQRRIGAWFARNHWERGRLSRGGKQAWIFRRPGSPVPPRGRRPTGDQGELPDLE